MCRSAPEVVCGWGPSREVDVSRQNTQDLRRVLATVVDLGEAGRLTETQRKETQQTEDRRKRPPLEVPLRHLQAHQPLLTPHAYHLRPIFQDAGDAVVGFNAFPQGLQL